MSSLPAISGYNVVKELGRGHSGVVYHCEHEASGKSYACKVIQKTEGKELPKIFNQEVTILKKLNHPNVIKLVDVIDEVGRAIIVLEYLPDYIPLFDCMISLNGQPLCTAATIKILGRVVMTLKYLHGQDIAHCDLKPENILVHPKTCDTKLIDFGLARDVPKVDGKDRLVRTKCGTRSYCSPEMLKGKGYDAKKNDVWNLGVNLFVMATNRLPFPAEDASVLEAEIKAGKYTLPSFVKADMGDLISSMMNVDPAKRASLDDIINHPLPKTYGKYFSQKPVEGDQKEPPQEPTQSVS